MLSLGGLGSPLQPPREAGPPAPGADRQLVLYAWLHTAFEPGSESAVTLDGSELDKGHGAAALFKKLQRRGLRVEIDFTAGEIASRSTGGDADAEAPQSALAEPKHVATREAPSRLATAGWSLDASVPGMSITAAMATGSAVINGAATVAGAAMAAGTAIANGATMTMPPVDPSVPSPRVSAPALAIDAAAAPGIAFRRSNGAVKRHVPQGERSVEDTRGV